MAPKFSTSHLNIDLASLPTFPPWVDHPSWITGIDAIGAYHRWVETIVLPIAFEWIYENYDAVYQNIPKELEDDVGVVIAAAYQLVRKAPGFARAKRKLEEFQELERAGELDTSKLNPIWTKITDHIREATEDAFEAEKSYLDDTIP